MAKEIIWTSTAIARFNAVVNYLEQNWSENEVTHFTDSTKSTLEYIAKYPSMFRSPDGKYREALITEHNLMVYKVKAEFIVILTFFDTRQHPSKKQAK